LGNGVPLSPSVRLRMAPQQGDFNSVNDINIFVHIVHTYTSKTHEHFKLKQCNGARKSLIAGAHQWMRAKESC
jgi:hypothetical protein